MNFGDFAVSLWLIPVALQIFLPLVLFCGWQVIKFSLSLFGTKTSMGKIEPSFAR